MPVAFEMVVVTLVIVENRTVTGSGSDSDSDSTESAAEPASDWEELDDDDHVVVLEGDGGEGDGFLFTRTGIYQSPESDKRICQQTKVALAFVNASLALGLRGGRCHFAFGNTLTQLCLYEGKNKRNHSLTTQYHCL